VFFFLEGAKMEMEVVEAIEETVVEARDTYLSHNPTKLLHHLSSDIAALWPKIDHLLYQPILGLERPRCFYYYQGDGLEAIYGFTYKYMTLEHFLGQLARIQVSAPLAETLAAVYAQAWYPGDEPLTVFVDWHTKPHWTKFYGHSGHIAMWGRTMPGTKQLILNGSDGRYLGGWNYPIDTHMTHILVDLEAALELSLARSIACTVMDSEGGGQPLGERYAEAERGYISVLPREHTYCLADFTLEGCWEPVKDDPEREAIFARWADPQRAAEDPRQFVLMRLLDQMDPTRIYTGQFASYSAGEIPWQHRRRWPYNELRIRNLIHGANLNVNYGYVYTEGLNRTRQREWETAQERVAVTERQLADRQAAVHNLRQRLANLQNTYDHQRHDLQQQLIQQRLELEHRQRLEQTSARVMKRISGLRRQLNILKQRFRKRQRRLLQQLYTHQTQSSLLNERLLHRIALRDAIDTETLCRERDLEKDQVMLNWQILLANLHDWSAKYYFDSHWSNLSLQKATQMIYRKAGWVSWYNDRIEVVLEPYRYSDQQRAMEATCARFNARDVRWRDGRRIRISVASPWKF
jgi:transcriptional regulator of met regulon